MAPRAVTPYDAVFYVPSIAPLLAQDGTRPPGGAETQIRLLTRALADAGVSVAVVAFDHPGLPDRDAGVAVVRRAGHHASPVREAAAIAEVLRRAPSRVVVTRQAGAHTGLAALVTRAGRRRFVYSAANVLDFDFGSWESNRLKRLLFETGLRLSDRVVAQTDEQRDLCRRKLGVEAPVIRSIAEPGEQRDGVPEAFLWVGRVMGYKQPLAYLDLAQAVPEARFWMVAVPDDALEADRRLFQAVRDKAEDIPNLDLLPPSSRPELLSRMDRAVAVVSTSTSEGMPNIWLEGWARGVPAMTLTHDPDALIARHGLGSSCGGDAGALAADARRMWRDRGDQTELATRCRTYVGAEHSAAAVAAKWRNVLGV